MSEDLRSELEKYLEALNIQTRCVEHPPVTTEKPVFCALSPGFFQPRQLITAFNTSPRHLEPVNESISSVR